MPLQETEPDARLWFKRIGWLLLFWMLGVAALGIVALLLKGIMRMVGLGS